MFLNNISGIRINVERCRGGGVGPPAAVTISKQQQQQKSESDVSMPQNKGQTKSE